MNVAINQATASSTPLGDAPINRIDLLLLDRRKSINELNQQNTKAGFLPTVSAYGTGNNTVYAVGETIPPSKPTRRLVWPATELEYLVGGSTNF